MENFQYSLLQVADSRASDEYILAQKTQPTATERSDTAKWSSQSACGH